MTLSRRLLLAAGATLAVLLLLACSSSSQFDEPSNPVAQIPWPDYERLTYAIYDQTDAELGTLVLETRREGDIYVLRLRFELHGSDVTDEREVRVDARTLTPISSRLDAASADELVSVSGQYGTDSEGGFYVDGVVVKIRERTEEPIEERTEERIEAGDLAFDNDSSAWLWRSIAFAPDHELTYRSVNVYRGRSQLVQLAVRGQDTLRGPDGDVIVWQVVVTPGVEISRAWYEVEPPHRLIRWDQQPRRFLLREVSTEPPSVTP